MLVYALRGIAVSLSIFVLTYAFLRILVTVGWTVAERKPGRTLRIGPNALYLLQVGPFLAATLAVGCFAVPAFLRFEPMGASEEFGPPVIVLSLLCIALLGAGLYRALSAYLRTARLVRQWKRNATQVEDAVLPLYQTGPDSPPLVVAGMLRPRLLVSCSTNNLLNEEELARAIAHESAHIRNHDNVKKLALRVCQFPPMRSLEQSWLEALEISADQSAVNSKREALDLASALVKSSRLSRPTPELVTNLASPAGTLLHNRVERLLAWEQPEVAARYRKLLLPASLVTLAALAIARYDLLLWLVHELAEVLMH